MPNPTVEHDIRVPDIGDISEVEVIGVLVGPGDKVKTEDSLITVESDKASMDVPSPLAGTVKSLSISVGDQVSEASPILTLVVEESPEALKPQQPDPPSESDGAIEMIRATDDNPILSEPVIDDQPLNLDVEIAQESMSAPKGDHTPHASPSVRRFARELGAEIGKIKGTGRKGRIVQSDVQAHIKRTMESAKKPVGKGIGFTEMPEIDFSQFGKIEIEPLSRIKKLTGSNLHRNWVSIPHVTQHDEVDITDLEAFRKSLKSQVEQENVKVTLLPFLMKAVVCALKTFPSFNASLDSSGEQLVLKQYFHLGIAVDTPDGLVVPVIREVNQKGVWELARELAEIGERARNKKLTPKEMQGGSFTISSLGGISGTGFTPIINAPEVAILGVSRAKNQAVYQQQTVAARLMLPLSLSYDHRVIDGAEAARFTHFLSQLLSDSRRLLL